MSTLDEFRVGLIVIQILLIAVGVWQVRRGIALGWICVLLNPPFALLNILTLAGWFR